MEHVVIDALGRRRSYNFAEIISASVFYRGSDLSSMTLLIRRSICLQSIMSNFERERTA